MAFEVVSPDKLNKIFEDCHNMIWKKQKMSPTVAFYEFCKFIFIKIREDKKREGLPTDTPIYKMPLTLDWLSAQDITSVHPVRDLFRRLNTDLETAIVKDKKKRIYENNENFELQASTCKELIKIFQTVNLSSIDEDLNGRMFEVFLNAAVRGKELGQFFTPRPVVDFMTRIALQRSDFSVSSPPMTIDACSGTAGFLIEVMAYLLSKLRYDTRFTTVEKEAIKDKICNECLFGIEANQQVARIARINMYLHGDGGSHIFYGDGLDNHPEIEEDMPAEQKTEVEEHAKKVLPGSFDLVLSNPPFSMTYKQTNEIEQRILKQRDLSKNMASAKSNILFLSRYGELLKKGGEMLIVFDDTILNGSTCTDVRQWLLDEFIIIGIHSLPFNAFFKARANIKTSILHARKKATETEEQGHIFMSISNNIGHDNALNDTLEKNNLPDIFTTYVEWRRTGHIHPIYKDNHDLNENFECPEQAWLISPKEISVDRLDAYYYSPELKKVKAHLQALHNKGEIILKTGKDFTLREKISKSAQQLFIESGELFRYIEISYVTDYGLILDYVTHPFAELPSRGQYQIHTGDILMALNISSRGTVVIVPEEFNGAICTSGFLVIIPKDEEERQLLWYALRSEYCRKQIYYLSQTASQPELKKPIFDTEFLIPFPIDKKIAISETVKFQETIKSIRTLLNGNDVKLPYNVV